jgi:transposase-like protein
MVRMPCESCARPDTHAHHDDYDQPLQVRWLCPACHRQHHKETK